MKKKLVIAVIAVLILIIGVYGIYRVVKHFRRLATTPTAQTQETPAPALKSLSDLLGLNVAQKCTFDQGVIYVANGKVRGDYSYSVNGATTNSHMIVSGTTSYIWNDGATTGYKMSFSPSATPASSSGATSPSGFDASKPANYVCGGWVEDDTLFALPKGVKFTDISSMIPSGTPGTSGSSSQCSYCNTLTGNSKTQCLAALKCQ